MSGKEGGKKHAVKEQKKHHEDEHNKAGKQKHIEDPKNGTALKAPKHKDDKAEKHQGAPHKERHQDAPHKEKHEDAPHKEKAQKGGKKTGKK
ncbi:hypothetical protein SNE40_015303 [Patella caerulea]|uniref:Uncharacterized protein n=1 Tax=Patella caerulea TaxID=87958 RepID=A0AAN8JJN7_PATCE